MEGANIGVDRESAGALGGLFQHIIHDMKNGMPLWEDLIAKAAKLHSSLKATILAVTAYLEAFQKIADAATSARGATREIGTALTRICLRHKAVEARMKTFTSSIMEFLIIPLQDKLEDWKKTVLNLDKEHAKDYKRARAELKKRSTDTLRLQKKMRKCAGSDLQKRLECGLQDVNERRYILEETEKHAVKAVLLEERSRFCTFVGFLKPVVDEEIAMLTEISHLQEAVEQLEKHTADPHLLPPASEQVIADLKTSDGCAFAFQTPPSSPSSLGSRKSSMCSISSLNSSSSGSSKSHHSPSHHPHWQRSLSQPVGRSGTIRYMSLSSQDSGFTSQDTLYPRPPSSFSAAQVSNLSENSNGSSSSTPCTPFPGNVVPTTTSTWPNLQESMQFERAASAIINDRPHTISSAYEKGHQRPPLTVYTFQSPEQQQQLPQCTSQSSSPVIGTSDESNNSSASPQNSNSNSTGSSAGTTISPSSMSHTSNASVTTSNSNYIPPTLHRQQQQHLQYQHQQQQQQNTNKPPLPTRCSSLERPSGPIYPAKSVLGIQGVRVLPPTTVSIEQLKCKPSALPAHLTKSLVQPTYVNMHELVTLAASKGHDVLSHQQQQSPPHSSDDNAKGEGEKDGSTSESSLESSSGYGSQTAFNVDEHNQANDNDVSSASGVVTSRYCCTLPRNINIKQIPAGNIIMGSSNSSRNCVEERRRPVSMTALYSSIGNTGTLRNNILRRGSMQGGNKPPPPPIRRTSSITNTNTIGNGYSGSINGSQTNLSTSSTGSSLEHLPPPPAFLLEPSTTSNNSTLGMPNMHHSNNTPPIATGIKVAETVKALTELKHTPAGPNSVRRLAAIANNHQAIYTNAATVPNMQQQQQNHYQHLSTFQNQAKLAYVSQSGGVVYAQPAHVMAGGCATTTPIATRGPVLARRICSFRSQSAERKTSGPGGVGSNFIATLSAKLAPSLGPRATRRFSEESVHSATLGRMPRSCGPGQTFLDSLNAKLAQQQHMNAQTPSGILLHANPQPTTTLQMRAHKIRQLFNSRAQPDPKQCHESLMDQIKRGATLKRAKVINDRSAPKIF